MKVSVKFFEERCVVDLTEEQAKVFLGLIREYARCNASYSVDGGESIPMPEEISERMKDYLGVVKPGPVPEYGSLFPPYEDDSSYWMDVPVFGEVKK